MPTTHCLTPPITLLLTHCRAVQVSIGDGSSASAQELSDGDIAQLLQEHLGLCPAAFLAVANKQPTRAAGGPAGTQQQGSKAAGASKTHRPSVGQAAAKIAGYESVESFVGVMGKLLDMEREAEVAAAQEATSLCSTTAAQVSTRSDSLCQHNACSQLVSRNGPSSTSAGAGQRETGIQSQSPW